MKFHALGKALVFLGSPDRVFLDVALLLLGPERDLYSLDLENVGNDRHFECY